MTAFDTTVSYLPPTPLGRLAGRRDIRQRRPISHEYVGTTRLLEHAQGHDDRSHHQQGGAID